MLRATVRNVALRRHIRPIALNTEIIHLPSLSPSLSLRSRYASAAARPSPLLKPEKSDGINGPGRAFGTGAAAVVAPECDDAAMDGIEEAKQPSSEGIDPDLIILDTPDPPNVQNIHFAQIRMNHRELLATFQACLSKGMLARAQLMLLQLHQLLDKDAPELLVAHNGFLFALLGKAEADKSHLKLFFMWYEERTRGRFGIKGDLETFALLLKGSMKLPREEVGKQYLDHYVAEAKKAKIPIADILGNGILSKGEAKYIAKICNVKFEELSDEVKEWVYDNEPPVRPAILDVPEVIATAVRGHGLAAVKQSLRSLIDPNYIPHGTETQGIDPIERQKLLEDDAIASAIERWRKDAEEREKIGILSKTKSLNALLWEWHTAFVPLIKLELAKVAKAERAMETPGNSDRALYGPFLRLLDVDKISAITILEVLKVCNEGGIIADGVKSSRAVMAVGKMLENEVLSEDLQKRINRTPKDYLAQLFSSATKFNVFVKRARLRAARGQIEPSFAIREEWPPVIKAKLGAVLISMLMHCAKVTVKHKTPTGEILEQDQQAVVHSYQFIRGRKLGVIRLHNEVVKKLGIEPLRGGIVSRHLPMVVRPRPWLGPREGGYYYFPVKAVRTKDSREQDMYVKAASARGDLDQLFAGLDVLGSTSWAINERIFNVVLEVWNTGIGVAAVPPRESPVKIPDDPPPASTDPAVRYNWLKERKLAVVARRNHHSLRCDVNFKLEIARAFLKETFYFPHNVDFRGRAYPVPPHLNHIGNDLCRGLLTFAEGRELGESGLRWLKIHLSNVYGFDKASFSEREEFANSHIREIIDSVEKPLTGEKWWLTAEDSWQCLAACIALKEALDLPDPHRYKCKLPVAQDGTCNGLQHYAALGGDVVGAKQVNLEPSDRPQDVYTGVAELVRGAVKKDAEAGNEIAQRLVPLISRKVVKQTVMTNVYGVTFIGAKAQIQNQLKSIEQIKKNELSAFSLYLTRKVFHSVRSMFTGAHDIQEWLGQCAWRISRSISPSQIKRYCSQEFEEIPSPKRRIGRPKDESKARKGKLHYMTSVVWTTPLGLPVVQPYRNKNMQTVTTNLQNVFISDPNIIDEVNSRKQMSAFPPNYIHSLDATHMLLSALECHKSGVSFAAVHDSFWTHPSDVDTLNQILRDAFINLHSSDLIQKLHDEFLARYKGFKYLAAYPETSKVGTRIRKLRAERYLKFRKYMTASEELLMEIERDRLLASDDPEERKKGEEMVTPSSIVASASEGDFEEGSATPEEVKEFFGDSVCEMAEKDQPSGIVKLGSEEEVDVDMASEVAEVLGESISAPSAHRNAGDECGISQEGETVEYKANELEEEAEIENLETMLNQEKQKEKHNNMDTTVEKQLPKKRRGRPPSVGSAKKSSKYQSTKRINVWLPLTFPDVPKKGDFDVTRLEHSQYFFS